MARDGIGNASGAYTSVKHHACVHAIDTQFSVQTAE